MSIHPRHVTFSGTEGNKLEGDVYGHGDCTALLLHGGGQTRHAWRATARKLAERGFTAIPVDQRGHGESAWIDSASYTLPDYAMDAVSLGSQIERRFGAKPVAIGASLGGLASLYALGEAACFSALVLVDIVPRAEARGVAHVQAQELRRASPASTRLQNRLLPICLIEQGHPQRKACARTSDCALMDVGTGTGIRYSGRVRAASIPIWRRSCPGLRRSLVA